MTPGAYLCDLDGTLYHPGMMKWLMAAELALCGPHQLPKLQAFRRSHEALREETRAHPEIEHQPTPFDEQLKRSAELLQLDSDLLRHIVLDWMVQRPGKWIRRFKRTVLIDELMAFRADGGKLAVVSDYPAHDKLSAMGLLDLFDVVVASGEHPELTRLKPAPDGYLLAARELGVPPSACLVLGDRVDADGLAAERAGMTFRLVR